MFKISKNIICILITFNNPLKVCFSNKKYLITIQTLPAQIVTVYFLLKTVFLTDFQNQLLITFCSDLVCNNSLKARISTHTHTNIQLLISLLHIKSE